MPRKLMGFLAVVATVVILAPTAFAGNTGSVADDWANNASDYVTGDAAGECDTIDPILTLDRNHVTYKCRGVDLSSTGGENTLGLGNLTSTRLETVHSGSVTVSQPEILELPDPNDELGLGTVFATRHRDVTVQAPYMHISWQTQGPIPEPGATTLIEGFSGFTFSLWFQNPNAQNRRQITGYTRDCQRYAHMGPYLTGNREYLAINHSLKYDGVWGYETSWSHFDPIGFTSWAFLTDENDPTRTNPDGSANPRQQKSRPCVPDPSGNGLVPSPDEVNDQGTGSAFSIDSGNRTLHLYIPFRFRWIDNQFNPLEYELMAVGDPITSVSAQLSALVDAATTPAIQVGPVNQSAQGVQNTFLLDWIPWDSWDLGEVTPQTSALPGPSCPGYSALEYLPGGGKNGPGGTYLNAGIGPQGQDRDIQINALYANTELEFGNGLAHYDGWGIDGFLHDGKVANDLVVQDHLGLTGCSIQIPNTAGPTGTGFQPSGFTA